MSESTGASSTGTPKVTTTTTTAATPSKKKKEKVEEKLCPDGHILCDSCGECHECEEIAEKAARKASEPTTQKAKGLRVLQRCGWKAPAVAFVKQEDQLKNAYIKARSAVGDSTKPLFARPCPVRPRHGFVESRPVMTQDEAAVVFREARAADPEAEMMLSPLIAATHNMLWRPGLLAIGPKHDGATAGKASIGIPLLRLSGLEALGSMVKDAEIAEGEDPYIEAVMDPSALCYFTQIRSGARLESMGPDFIPERLLVRRVVEAEGDLLEWEATAEKLRGEEGVVVWHPGGTLASHFSVHCIQRRIPIVTTTEPRVGAVLEPAGEAPSLPDPAAVLNGIGAGTIAAMKGKGAREHFVCSVLTGLHHSAALGGANGFFIGVAAAAMVRLGYAASIGESRHSFSSPIHVKATPFSGGISRSQIYDKALTGSLFTARELVPEVLALFFKAGVWSSGGYGGPKWGSCLNATVQLDNAIITLAKTPSPEGVLKVVSALNNAVNQAHNNGWWLNKFADTGMFDLAVKGDPRCIIPAGVFFYDTTLISEAKRSGAVADWAAQPLVDTEKIIKSPESIVVRAATKIAAKAPSQKPKVTYAHAKPVGSGAFHIQYKVANAVDEEGEVVDADGYKTIDVTPNGTTLEDLKTGDAATSLAGGSTAYWTLVVKQVKGKVTFQTSNEKPMGAATLWYDV